MMVEEVSGGELSYLGIHQVVDENGGSYKVHRYRWDHPDGRKWLGDIDYDLIEASNFTPAGMARLMLKQTIMEEPQ